MATQKTVRFTKPWRIYTVGSSYGFPVKIADQLIADGIAVAVPEPAEVTAPVTK